MGLEGKFGGPSSSIALEGRYVGFIEHRFDVVALFPGGIWRLVPITGAIWRAAHNFKLGYVSGTVREYFQRLNQDHQSCPGEFIH
jgi:hypothetical protein